jgi:hypothetical protein
MNRHLDSAFAGFTIICSGSAIPILNSRFRFIPAFNCSLFRVQCSPQGSFPAQPQMLIFHQRFPDEQFRFFQVQPARHFFHRLLILPVPFPPFFLQPTQQQLILFPDHYFDLQQLFLQYFLPAVSFFFPVQLCLSHQTSMEYLHRMILWRAVYQFPFHLKDFFLLFLPHP